MRSDCFDSLHSTISKFTNLHVFIDDDFITKQCTKGLKSYILKGLSGEINIRTTDEFKQHLPKLERRLKILEYSEGYAKLKGIIQNAVNWETYQNFLAQVDITLWFKNQGILIEIEPELPHDFRIGYGDALIFTPNGNCYCEIHSSSSLINVNQQTSVNQQKQKTKKVERILLEKTNIQLPIDYPGILCLDATKAPGIWSYDVREIAEKLFPNRQQLAMIMLWSWESNGEPSWDMIPNSFFVNSHSKFRNVGECLLKHLNIKSEIMVI